MLEVKHTSTEWSRARGLGAQREMIYKGGSLPRTHTVVLWPLPTPRGPQGSPEKWLMPGQEPGTSCGTKKSKGHGGQLVGLPLANIWGNLSIKKNNDCKTVKIHVFMILKRRKKIARAPLEVAKAQPHYSVNRK